MFRKHKTLHVPRYKIIKKGKADMMTSAKLAELKRKTEGLRANKAATEKAPEIHVKKADVPEGYKLFSEVFGFDPTEFIGLDVPVRCYVERPDVPAIDENYIFQKPLLAEYALSRYMGHKVFLSGWSGTGKSTLSEQFCAHTGKSWYRENMTSSMEADELFGKVHIRNSGGVPVTEFVPTKFVEVLSEPYEICMDEIFAARPTLLQSLQRLFESTGVLRIADANIEVEPHHELSWCLTDNTKGSGDNLDLFASRNVQDTSFLNRIETALTVDYLPQELEVDLVQSWAKLDTKVCKDIVAVGRLVRDGYQKRAFSKTISPRQLKTVAARAELTGNVKRAWQATFGNFLTTDEAEAFNGILNTVGVK